MKQKQKKYCKKSGAITVEVAIGIALAAVVLIVAIGLFNENLSTMISNSGIANMFNNTGKTTYDKFNRDYASSQINIQLIGEQGLSMLRSLANNKAITQIDKYMDGTDTSYTNVNSIGYLAAAINAIVGSPDICVYMKKDSDKKCDDPEIGGTLYNVTLNGSSIAFSKVGGGINVKTPIMGNDFSGGASGMTITPAAGSTTTSGGNPMTSGYSPVDIDPTVIYEYIKDLSAFAEDSNTVYDYDILIKASNAGTSSPTASIAAIQAQINTIFSIDILNSLQYAHDACADDILGHKIDLSKGAAGCGSTGEDLAGQNTSFIGNDEIHAYRAFLTKFTKLITNSTDVSNLSSTLNGLLNNPEFLNIIYTTLREDNVPNTITFTADPNSWFPKAIATPRQTTCAMFTKELTGLTKSPYNLTITIPPCIPSGG
jgi:hypothetical protein